MNELIKAFVELQRIAPPGHELEMVVRVDPINPQCVRLKVCDSSIGKEYQGVYCVSLREVESANVDLFVDALYWIQCQLRGPWDREAEAARKGGGK